MSGKVMAWPKATGTPMDLPRRIVRPCDYGLLAAVNALETQVGTIEAYNRLVEAATAMKSRIDAGKSEPQHPMFAVSIKGEVPDGRG